MGCVQSKEGSVWHGQKQQATAEPSSSTSLPLQPVTSNALSKLGSALPFSPSEVATSGTGSPFTSIPNAATVSGQAVSQIAEPNVIRPGILQTLKSNGEKEAFEKEVVLQQKLGQGASGVVYRGLWNGQQVAIKHITASLLRDTDVAQVKAAREAALGSQLEHPGIVRTLHCYTFSATENTIFGAVKLPHVSVETYIITEYCDLGTLAQRLKQPGHMPIRRSSTDLSSRRIKQGASYPCTDSSDAAQQVVLQQLVAQGQPIARPTEVTPLQSAQSSFKGSAVANTLFSGASVALSPTAAAAVTTATSNSGLPTPGTPTDSGAGQADAAPSPHHRSDLPGFTVPGLTVEPVPVASSSLTTDLRSTSQQQSSASVASPLLTSVSAQDSHFNALLPVTPVPSLGQAVTARACPSQCAPCQGPCSPTSPAEPEPHPHQHSALQGGARALVAPRNGNSLGLTVPIALSMVAVSPPLSLNALRDTRGRGVPVSQSQQLPLSPTGSNVNSAWGGFGSGANARPHLHLLQAPTSEPCPAQTQSPASLSANPSLEAAIHCLRALRQGQQISQAAYSRFGGGGSPHGANHGGVSAAHMRAKYAKSEPALPQDPQGVSRLIQPAPPLHRSPLSDDSQPPTPPHSPATPFEGPPTPTPAELAAAIGRALTLQLLAASVGLDRHSTIQSLGNNSFKVTRALSMDRRNGAHSRLYQRKGSLDMPGQRRSAPQTHAPDAVAPQPASTGLDFLAAPGHAGAGARTPDSPAAPPAPPPNSAGLAEVGGGVSAGATVAAAVVLEALVQLQRRPHPLSSPDNRMQPSAAASPTADGPHQTLGAVSARSDISHEGAASGSQALPPDRSMSDPQLVPTEAQAANAPATSVSSSPPAAASLVTRLQVQALAAMTAATNITATTRSGTGGSGSVLARTPSRQPSHTSMANTSTAVHTLLHAALALAADPSHPSFTASAATVGGGGPTTTQGLARAMLRAGATGSVVGRYAGGSRPASLLGRVASFRKVDGGYTLRPTSMMSNFSEISLDQLLEVIDVLCDLAAALCYLHSRGIVHGDLKTTNILLQSSPGSEHGYRVKVADFGVARMMQDSTSHITTEGMRGTPAYVAPELVDAGKLSPACDVYAFGILMWEMVTHTLPFQDLSFAEMMSAKTLGQLDDLLYFPAGLPWSFENLARACWGLNPDTRPTTEEVWQELDRIKTEVLGGSVHFSLDHGHSDLLHLLEDGAVLDIIHSMDALVRSNLPSSGMTTHGMASLMGLTNTSRPQTWLSQTPPSIMASSPTGGADHEGGLPSSSPSPSLSPTTATASAAEQVIQEALWHHPTPLAPPPSTATAALEEAPTAAAAPSSMPTALLTLPPTETAGAGCTQPPPHPLPQQPLPAHTTTTCTPPTPVPTPSLPEVDMRAKSLAAALPPGFSTPAHAPSADPGCAQQSAASPQALPATHASVPVLAQRPRCNIRQQLRLDVHTPALAEAGVDAGMEPGHIFWPHRLSSASPPPPCLSLTTGTGATSEEAPDDTSRNSGQQAGKGHDACAASPPHRAHTGVTHAWGCGPMPRSRTMMAVGAGASSNSIARASCDSGGPASPQWRQVHGFSSTALTPTSAELGSEAPSFLDASLCLPASLRAPGGSVDAGGSQGSGGSGAGRWGLPRTRSHTFMLLQALTVDTPHASRPASLDVTGGRSGSGMSRAGSCKNNVA